MLLLYVFDFVNRGAICGLGSPSTWTISTVLSIWAHVRTFPLLEYYKMIGVNIVVNIPLQRWNRRARSANASRIWSVRSGFMMATCVHVFHIDAVRAWILARNCYRSQVVWTELWRQRTSIWYYPPASRAECLPLTRKRRFGYSCDFGVAFCTTRLCVHERLPSAPLSVRFASLIWLTSSSYPYIRSTVFQCDTKHAIENTRQHIHIEEPSAPLLTARSR